MFRRSLLLPALAGALLAMPPAPLAAQQAPRAATPAAATTPEARVARLLRTTPLVDGHNDLPWAIREDSIARGSLEAYDLRTRTRGHTDLPRLKAGMVGGQFWSVYIPGERGDDNYSSDTRASASSPGYARVQLEQIELARRTIARYPDRLELVTTAAGVRDAFRRGKVGSLLGMEGGHAIENSLGALRAYHQMGVRYMTLTHNVTLDWADAAGDVHRHGGLTAFGVEVVREMNRLGMLVDLSHVSPGTMSDALDASAAPVIFSHSSARALTDVPRNVPDSILARLPKNGGVVMVTFVPAFISQKLVDWQRPMGDSARAIRTRFGADSAGARGAIRALRDAGPRATLADVADHIEHVRKVAGIDHVGIGGDFDGIGETPTGLDDVSSYPRLLAELARRGWSDAELRKLAGENILRVMTQAEAVAARLAKEKPASNARIAGMK
jgi:membrane dipeptidase